MAPAPENWKTQIRKGYLELCLLRLIDREDRIYGFDLIENVFDFRAQVSQLSLKHWIFIHCLVEEFMMQDAR